MANKNKTEKVLEENTGSRIRTKKSYFMDGGQGRTPAPTIPGVVPMSKQKSVPQESTKKSESKSKPKTEKQGTPKKKNDKKTAVPAAEAKVKKDPAQVQEKTKSKKEPAQAQEKSKPKKEPAQTQKKPKKQQKQQKKSAQKTQTPPPEMKPAQAAEQENTMQRKKQKSGRKSAENRQHVKQTRRSQHKSVREDVLLECRFSYSGHGYGFAEQPDADTEDIFIAPRATMDAMTGDTVQVRITADGRRDGQSAEGEVVAILEHNVPAIIGTLLQSPDGVYYVMPNKEKLRTPVYVPYKDVENLDIGSNTKVEVIPEGMPYFVRSKNIAVQRRSPAKRDKKNHRRENTEDSPFFELSGRISAVFGDAGSREANYAAILHESGIRTDFPPYVIKAAENASAEVLTSAGRQDIRDRIIFTIDGAGAKDLDDAISLEKTDDGYILGVHIADVSHYAPFGSCIENEARLRGTSVYFTDKVVPMLPKALSNHACSLNADSDKYALSCEITLDKAGNRTHAVVYKSRLKSAVRGVYEEVNDLFAQGETSEFYEKYRHVLPVLEDMKELYHILAARSEERGVMELESPEPEILLDETGFPVSILPRIRGDAEKMIEQFMLQANMAVAELLQSLNLPCLYRIHDEPSPEKIKTFAVFAHNLGLSTYDLADYGASDKDKQALPEKLASVLAQAKDKGIGEIVSSVLLRSMMKAKYVSVCSPHFGLGVPVYCHFTSPIRRYPDLFVHNVLSAVLPYAPEERLTAGTVLPPESFPKQLAAECAPCGISSTETEINAQNAEWKIEDLYMALYMSAHIGEVFGVTVDSVIKQGIFVRCDNLAEGMLPASMIPDARINVSAANFQWRGKTYTLGSKMQLTLTESDPSSGKITFAPVE